MKGHHPQRWGSRAGFSLTEAVLLIAIIGIIGVTAAPRFLDLSATDARFSHRETLAALRYARKLAVASHCSVEVDFTSSGFSLLQRSSCTSGSYTQAVFNPATGAPGFTATMPGSVALSSSLDPLYFDALGRVTDASNTATNVTISIGGLGISAAGESGFIYVP